MTDLISQLFDIATNEEFSPEQRKEMLAIALRGHAFLHEPMTKGMIGIVVESEEADKQEFKSALDGIVSDFKSTENGKIAEKQFVDFMVDKALGRHLTKETLPNGGIRFGLRQEFE